MGGACPDADYVLKNEVSIGAWLSLARALGLGPRGRAFKSHRPDQLVNSSQFTEEDVWVLILKI